MTNLTHVKMFEGMGRGLITTMPFNKSDVGMTIAVCELLVLDAVDTEIVERTELRHYTFKYSIDRDCLVLGNGEIFNHSDTPNVSYVIEEIEEGGEVRKMMVFRCIKPWQAGDQLFINYNADVVVNTEEYIASKSLVG